MSIQLIWIGDLDETKTQRLQNPQALSYEWCHPKKMLVRQDKKETRIGRKNSKMPPDYALESAVSNRMISRNHVTIERLSKGNYMLYDHSLNGTYVNFVRVIGGTVLKHEDIVCFGHINGANIKPGESVTPFATDLKYRVEIIDKPIDCAGMVNEKKSGSVRKGYNYSHSESSQYEEISLPIAAEQKKSIKPKTKSNENKVQSKKSMKPVKQHHQRDYDGSDQSSDVSNSNANMFKKQKKVTDLSSLSSSVDDDDDDENEDDDDDNANSRRMNKNSSSKDRHFNKRMTTTSTNEKKHSQLSSSSRKHSSVTDPSRFKAGLATATTTSSVRKRKMGPDNSRLQNTSSTTTGTANQSMTFMKKSSSISSSHNPKSSRSSGSKLDDDRDRRMFQSGSVHKETKVHLNQKTSSQMMKHLKYSDSSIISASNAGGSIGADGGAGNVSGSHGNNTSNNNNSSSNNNRKSTKRNVNSMNSNYDYEECSAHPCLRPDGENLIDWIMCDKCALWFHQSCVGLDEVLEDDESYYCPYCVQ